MTQLSLGRLTPRSAERLVRAVLGPATPASTVTRIVERADGNAFYLEELIRRIAEGGGDTLPETVLALAQSRLERLEPDARRVVRAAGVFGEVFWRGGVASLLGAGTAATDLDTWLDVLCEREVLTAAHETRVPGEQQYSFRHDLLREAAYAMLTDSDRTTGHRLAGEWLEAAGERDPLSLADHFERGGEPKRAMPWLLRSALTALSGGNVEAALALGHRGVACGAEGGERGLLRQVQGTALFMRGHMAASVEMSREAITLLRAGSTPWFVSASEAFLAGMFLADPGVTGPVLKAIVDASVEPEPSGPYGLATNGTCMALTAIGQLDLARSLLRRAEALEATTPEPDLAFVFWLRIRRCFFETMSGELGSALETLDESRSLARRTEDARARGSVGMMTVEVLAQTGHRERAEAACHELRAFCEPRRLGVYADWGALHLALGQVITRGAREAMASLMGLMDRSDRFLATSARAYVAEALLAEGDLPAATREATRSLEEGAAFPILQAHALGVRALIELRRGVPAEAFLLAERGLEAESRAPWPSVGSLLHLARAEALRALGRTDDANGAITHARDRVLRIAATLDGDPVLRESYLAGITSNARTLELARAWLLPSPVVA
jgi:tetratricopeptide (TPR) repeat protein